MSQLFFTTSHIFATMTPMATGPVTFLHQVLEELKKVTWPSKDEIIRLTALVLAISLIVGLYIGGLDFLFTKITETVIK